MKMGFTWWYLTEKRLFKKPGYLLVLLLVPLLTVGMRMGSKEEAGMVTVGLCCEEQGGLSEEIIEDMMNQPSVLRFLKYDTEEAAIRAVEAGKVSAAWIFPAKLDEKLNKMAERGRISSVIRVVEREDDISLVFTREVLCSFVYPQLAYRAYESFTGKHLEEDISKEELRDFYRSVFVGTNLFQAVYVDGAEDGEDHYLLAPVRGMLAIWLVVSGLAAVLFYKRDERLGVYDAVPVRRRIRYAFGLQTVVLFNGGVIYLAACRLLGVLGSLWRECLMLFLFLGCIACFCVLLGLLFSRMESIGVLIPVFVIAMVVGCPVFLKLRLPWPVRLLPPYYYLNSLHSSQDLANMMIYLCVGMAVCFLENRLKYHRS